LTNTCNRKRIVPINFNVGIFYGQREKWQGDHDLDVLRHPGGRLQRVATFFSVSRALIVDVVLLVILLIGIPAVGWVLFRELRQTAVTVYPVSIPEACLNVAMRRKLSPVVSLPNCGGLTGKPRLWCRANLSLKSVVKSIFNYPGNFCHSGLWFVYTNSAKCPEY
jgi:hypothetical protein